MPCLSPSPHNRKSNRVSDQSSVWARIVSRMSIRAPFSIRERRRLKFAPGARIVGRQEGPPEYRSRGGTVIEYLARDLGACIRLRAAIVVRYPLPVDEPPVSIPFLEHSLFDLIGRLERDGFEASAHLCVCRDRDKALLQVLKRNALVVIGGKK